MSQQDEDDLPPLDFFYWVTNTQIILANLTKVLYNIYDAVRNSNNYDYYIPITTTEESGTTEDKTG